MPPNRPKQDLRDISHLFLSSVRDRQTAGAPRPQRISPQQRAEQSIELSAEEMVEVTTAAGADVGAAERQAFPPQIICVLAGHLGVSAHEKARDYAAAWCRSPDSPRVGLIELDASELCVRVLEYDPRGVTCGVLGSQPGNPFPELELDRVLDELAREARRWIVVPRGSPRSPECRGILQSAASLVLLTTSDPSGTVAAYRVLKGLADAFNREARALPTISLAPTDAAIDPSGAQAAYLKIATVASKFLGCQVQRDPVPAIVPVSERVVLHQRGTQRRAEQAGYGQLIADWVARHAGLAATVDAGEAAMAEPPFAGSAEMAALTKPDHPFGESPSGLDEQVIDLPPSVGGDEARAIIAAVLATPQAGWVACPISPPTDRSTCVAVSRDRCLTLLAVAGEDMSRIASAARTYQWLCQNRELVAMAMPQMNIDALAMPRLVLLVDQSETVSDQLRSIVAGGNVTVLGYRKVRWSGKSGLLLQAA